MPRHIPALTGLRFLAAFTVVLAHGLLATAQFHQDPPVLAALKYLSGLGMSIFFVLSGFVIHYTYAQSLSQKYGIYNFFVARFARLYPLYLLLFLLEYGYMHLWTPDSIPPFGQEVRALRYYFTLTQTWWYAIYNDVSLVYQFGPIGQISWSISTEFWFYLAYPLLLLLIRRLRQPGTIITTSVIYSIAAVGVISLSRIFQDEISELGLRAFGEVADGRITPGQDSLVRWLVYFSPYSRILEFIIGCLAAQMFMRLSDVAVGPREHRLGFALSAFAVFAVVVTQVVLYGQNLPFKIPFVLRDLNMCFGFAPWCALLIFCCARYRNVFTAPFSWRPAVVLGDASYSIYLLHMAFFSTFRAQPVEATFLNIVLRLGLFVGVTAMLLVTSLITYRIIEMPARRWIRATLSVRINKGDMLQHWRFGAGCGLVVVALAVSVATYMRDGRIGYKQWLATSNAIDRQVVEGAIDVLGGTYGASCVAIENNARESLRRRCNGQKSCDYIVNVAILGDPAPGCVKDFKATWRCSSQGQVNTLFLPGEAGLRSLARLSCPPPGSG